MQSWADVVANPLLEVWSGFAAFVPTLVGAIIILIVGLLVAAGLGALVEKILEAIKLDTMLKKLGIEPYFERAGMQLKGAKFVGRLVYWFITVVFILAAADALRLTALSGFLTEVLAYIPNVVAAILIMLAAVVIGHALRRLVTASILGAKLHAGEFLGTFTWWVVVIFGFFAALVQLQVAVTVINALVTGLIAMLALAGGLAFGLGGKDYAAYLISKLRERTEGRK